VLRRARPKTLRAIYTEGTPTRAVLTVVDAHADDDGREDDGAERAQVVEEAQRVDVGQLAQDQLDDAEVDDELLQRHAAAGPVRLVHDLHHRV